VTTWTIHVQLSPIKQCDFVIKIVQNIFRLPSHTHAEQTILPLSNCSTDDLMVKSRPLLLIEVVDVTDSLAVDAHLQLAPDCIVHRFEIRAVWRPLQGWYKIQVSRLSISTVSRARWAVDADVRVNFIERRPMFLETVTFDDHLWKV